MVPLDVMPTAVVIPDSTERVEVQSGSPLSGFQEVGVELIVNVSATHMVYPSDQIPVESSLLECRSNSLDSWRAPPSRA